MGNETKRTNLGAPAARTATHTPGFWQLESESRPPHGSDLIITDSEGGYSIATCLVGSTGVKSVEEAEANARLIAMAPALRFSLRRLTERGLRLMAWFPDGNSLFNQDDLPVGMRVALQEFASQLDAAATMYRQHEPHRCPNDDLAHCAICNAGALP